MSRALVALLIAGALVAGPAAAQAEAEAAAEETAERVTPAEAAAEDAEEDAAEDAEPSEEEAAAAAVAAEAEAILRRAAAPPPDRIGFELRVPPEKGGGRISGTAARLESSGEDLAVLSGDVEIRFRDLTVRAQRLTLDRISMTLEAEGDVVFDQGTRRIAATRADLDLAGETGSFWNASAYAAPDQYFSGEVVVKTGTNTYEVRRGVLTSCTGDPTPDWSFRVSSADIEVGGYAHLRNATMRLKKLPILYWPYMIYPAKTERSSGFLIPNIGYTRRRGTYLGIAYYQVMGPSADLTLQLDGYESTYAGAGAELRYAPSEGTRGNMTYYVLSDRDTSRSEWRALWRHSASDLPGGFKGVISVDDYSDYDFFREFQRGEVENTRSFLYSNAFLSGSWGAQSLSFIVDQRETFLPADRTSTQRQLPEINYRVRKLKLGKSQFYFSLDSTAGYYFGETTDLFSIDYGRFDIAPGLTLPLRVAPWFSLAVSAGGRATWWGETVPVLRRDPETDEVRRVCEDGEAEADRLFCGESLTRTYSTVAVDAVGPSFARIFDGSGKRFAKYKHVIEPRFAYNRVSDFEDQDRVLRFDEIDSFSASESGSVALVNRVLAKPADEKQGSAFEILSFELAQGYSFREDQPLQRSRDGSLTSRESPIFARLRYSPSRVFDLQGRATWSTLFSGLESTSLSMRARGGAPAPISPGTPAGTSRETRSAPIRRASASRST
jgi:LPS-assembly protein